ncbi:MAG: hypothetical protein M0035_14600 [Actinomycetota bacterium]|nr:hypothetical protein [Actinomycetota bacterium]
MGGTAGDEHLVRLDVPGEVTGYVPGEVTVAQSLGAYRQVWLADPLGRSVSREAPASHHPDPTSHGGHGGSRQRSGAQARAGQVHEGIVQRVGQLGPNHPLEVHARAQPRLEELVGLPVRLSQGGVVVVVHTPGALAGRIGAEHERGPRSRRPIKATYRSRRAS